MAMFMSLQSIFEESKYTNTSNYKSHNHVHTHKSVIEMNSLHGENLNYVAL